MAVKLEAQQGVAQGVLIQTVEGHTAPRRGILQACAAYHVAFMGMGWRQPAAGAARPGVRGEQGGAARAELTVCDRVKTSCRGYAGRNICRNTYEGGSLVLRNTMCSGCGRERAQAVHTAVLRQTQAVLPAGQTEKDMREKARHAVVLWVTCRRGKAARPLCRQPYATIHNEQRASSNKPRAHEVGGAVRRSGLRVVGGLRRQEWRGQLVNGRFRGGCLSIFGGKPVAPVMPPSMQGGHNGRALVQVFE